MRDESGRDDSPNAHGPDLGAIDAGTDSSRKYFHIQSTWHTEGTPAKVSRV